MTESGDRLGSHYTIDRPLGSGAMGEVWLAHDESGKKVAVKLLHPHLTSDKAIVRRFIEEREILTSIHSPGVVEVFDMVMEGDKLGIVMEYVDGPNLSSELKIHAERHEFMQERYAARFAAEICDGLAAVHAARICHRDVKPANVLLSRGPHGDWHPKLTDFGISKVLSSTLEGTTAFAGTPRYMAPEIIKGRTPCPASDLYSFGVMLYEMVAGHAPFTAPNREAVILAHLEQDPRRPSGISDAMWYVISCCLAKEPTNRPSSAAAVATALRRIGDGMDPGVLVSPAAPAGPTGATVRLTDPPPGWTSAPTQVLTPAASPSASPTSQYLSAPPRPSPPARSAEPEPPRRRGKIWIPALVVLLAALVVAGIAFDPFGWRTPVAEGSPSAGTASSAGRTNSGTTTGAAPQPTQRTSSAPPADATLPAGVTQCSPKVGVGTKNTSCELAANVAADIPDNPGDQFTVDAYSPVTGKTYTLTCTSGTYYRCVKEKNNIEVYVIK